MYERKITFGEHIDPLRSGQIVHNVEEIRPHPFTVLATAVCAIIHLMKVHTNRAAGSKDMAAYLFCESNGRNGCLENPLEQRKGFRLAKLIMTQMPRLKMSNGIMELT